MSRARVEQQLTGISERLKALRTEERVAAEQLDQLAAEADDARLRALVSETPLSAREHREAERHAEAMRRHRTDLTTQIRALEQTQDELLDRLLDGSA
jgi:hypothetical protein